MMRQIIFLQEFTSEGLSGVNFIACYGELVQESSAAGYNP